MFDIQSNQYQDSVVALIDVLGFSEAVRKINEPGDAADLKVREAIRSLAWHEDYEKNPKYEAIRQGKSIEVSFFSDTLVFTLPQRTSAATDLIYRAHMVGCGLMYSGFLPRGGISTGKSFHDDRVFYGEGVVDAHVMESELAIYPRILVSDQVAEQFFRETPSGRKDFLRRDTDGFYYVDVFLGPTGWLLADRLRDWSAANIESHHQKVAACIKAGIAESKGKPKVLAKYIWAASKHNDCVSAEYRVAVPEICSA